MATLLTGKPVVDRLAHELAPRIEALGRAGIVPALAIVRMGERPDDLSYERTAQKRAESLGIAVRPFVLPEDAPQEVLEAALAEVNADASIHGCLLFRPLPRHMDEGAVCAALSPAKDVDGITPGSLASVFSGDRQGYPPCTAQACMELLDYYGYDLTGRRAVVVGRSLVIGRPAAMLLLGRNATVTLCHTRTADLAAECRRAEVLIAAAGKAKVIGADHLAPGQVVIDVGINVDEDGSLTGDVDFAAAQDVVRAITPVPGGVGAVTTTVLARHVLEAAARASGLTLPE